MAAKGSLKNFIFTCIIYTMLARLFLAQLFAGDGGVSMKNPIVSIALLFICLKLAKYWFPLLKDIFRLFKKFLLFCWCRKTKTTGAKKAQPKSLYKKH